MHSLYGMRRHKGGAPEQPGGVSKGTVGVIELASKWEGKWHYLPGLAVLESNGRGLGN